MTRGRYQHLAPPSKMTTENYLRFFGHILGRPADRFVQRVRKNSSGPKTEKQKEKDRKGHLAERDFKTKVVKEDLRTLSMDKQFTRDVISVFQDVE
ncbi:hypothetical protein RB195_005119 [Necator americanus]|uniref:Uncharacterized protein n=1 Tax=Necator americanus TaxID=51031 RepID=A0ABR1BN48_NECAM